MSDLSSWTTRHIDIDLSEGAKNFELDEMFFVACADKHSRLWQIRTYFCAEQWLMAMEFLSRSKYSPQWMKDKARNAIKSYKPSKRERKISLAEPCVKRELYYDSGTRHGFVYLASGDGYYKIGLSKNPVHRIETIGSKLPFELEILCSINTNDTRRLESELHRKFDDKRLSGEWFRLDHFDVEEIKGMGE